MWPNVTVPEILQMRVTAQAWDDAIKYGPYCELFIIFKINREPELTEPHLSLSIPFARLESELPAKKDHPCRGALPVYSWLSHVSVSRVLWRRPGPY